MVPLIRAAAVMPMLRWLASHGYPVDALLREVDLASLAQSDPMQPIPLVSGLELLRRAGQLEGPDVSCRIVSETSELELLLLGKVALGARTPREAFARIAAAIPQFCTHEHLTIDSHERGVVVRQFYAIKLAPETLHLVHQYVAEMTRTLCRMAGAKKPILRRVEIAPHPEFGLDHLHGWFGDSLVPTRRRTVSLFIEESVVDRTFPSRARDRTAGRLPARLTPLRGDGTFAGSLRILIANMLDHGSPSLSRLSAAAGMSVRTLQRRLDAEGTNFSAVLDDVRRSRAIKRVTEGNDALGAVAAELGYARQASLTRAVRRWTGRSPRQLRSKRSE